MSLTNIISSDCFFEETICNSSINVKHRYTLIEIVFLMADISRTYVNYVHMYLHAYMPVYELTTTIFL